MKTIAIMGLGLMGSSLGLALKRCEKAVGVRAYARRAETCATALVRGVADAAFVDPVEAVRGADLIVFCVPVLTIPTLATACVCGLKPGALLTDVGSTKAELAAEMEGVLSGVDASFVGSHPICGSEQQGIDAGDARLYEGAVCVVTPHADADAAAVAAVSRLWTDVGASVRQMSPTAHDEVLAATSHLPHVIAALLVRSVDDGVFCGSGFRDTTRVAEGSPQVWSDIVRTNAPALKIALKKFQDQLDELNALVTTADGEQLMNWFAEVRDRRKELLD